MQMYIVTKIDMVMMFPHSFMEECVFLDHHVMFIFRQYYWNLYMVDF